jgi:arginyl-tRNA synthetase
MVQDGLYMNEQAVEYVGDLRNLSIPEKVVAFTLAGHADEAGEALIPFDVLAAESSVKMEKLPSVIQSLESKGVLSKAVGVFRINVPVAA